MRIRTAKPEDAERLMELMADAEKSNFMLFEPGERKPDPAQFRKRIESVGTSRNSVMLLAEKEKELQAYLFAFGSDAIRADHTVYIVIGTSEKSRGKGIGTKLFEKLEEWAQEQAICRLELTVMVHNKAGLHLYQKMGFKIEGLKKNSLKIDGEYIDEYFMAKLV